MRVFDTDSDNHISFEEYIRGMSVFLKGKLEEKLKCRWNRGGAILMFYHIDMLINEQFASRSTT